MHSRAGYYSPVVKRAQVEKGSSVKYIQVLQCTLFYSNIMMHCNFYFLLNTLWQSTTQWRVLHCNVSGFSNLFAHCTVLQKRRVHLQCSFFIAVQLLLSKLICSLHLLLQSVFNIHCLGFELLIHSYYIGTHNWSAQSEIAFFNAIWQFCTEQFW